MGLALEQARQAAAVGEVPVGAVIVKDGRLIATGRNAPIAGHDPTAHAEVVALREAARVLGNYRLDGCSLYVTLEPCAMCSGAMVLDLFSHPQLNHQTRVHGGVCACACAQLLKDFFKPRRVNACPLREDALRTPDAAFDGIPPLPGTASWLSDLPSLQGLRLHVQDTGPLDAPQATLWVHGPDSWSLGWRDALLAPLAGRHVLPDLIGFGRSDKPKKEAFHQLQTHAQVLDELCDRLALAQVTLLGPPEIQALLRQLANLGPQRYEIGKPASAAPLSPAWREAPYPDKGYRAGPRALSRRL